MIEILHHLSSIAIMNEDIEINNLGFNWSFYKIIYGENYIFATFISFSFLFVEGFGWLISHSIFSSNK